MVNLPLSLDVSLLCSEPANEDDESTGSSSDSESSLSSNETEKPSVAFKRHKCVTHQRYDLGWEIHQINCVKIGDASMVFWCISYEQHYNMGDNLLSHCWLMYTYNNTSSNGYKWTATLAANECTTSYLQTIDIIRSQIQCMDQYLMGNDTIACCKSTTLDVSADYNSDEKRKQ